jgi:hypothetical protein
MRGKPSVCLVNVIRLLLDAGAMAESSLVHRVAAPAWAGQMLTRSDGEDDAPRISGPDDRVLRLGGAVHEVPRSQWPLLALDDQQCLAREDEEVLLIGLPVVHPHLFTRREHIETDSNLWERRFAFEAQTLSSPLLVTPGALTGVQDEPALRGGHEPSLGLFERCLGRSQAETVSGRRPIGTGIDSPLVFTVEQRDALREHLLRLAKQDERVVAGAAVGSLAVDGGDRFSDLDLTFGIADHVQVADVLDDWTRTLVGELDAVHLADLERGPTSYRVFVFPDALQFDLSMTPAAQFRPAGPRFRLLFGETAAGESDVSKPPVAADLFGWGVIYALHARACIERGRVWQAEHYVGAVRDHALSLACLGQGLPAVHARGYDDLPTEILARFEAAHVGALDAEALRAALAASVLALLRGGAEARLPHADTVAQRLAELH